MTRTLLSILRLCHLTTLPEQNYDAVDSGQRDAGGLLGWSKRPPRHLPRRLRSRLLQPSLPRRLGAHRGCLPVPGQPDGV
ncbi:hypothetical protein E2C01_020007 [Portunus trituberculatus]|uniref:Uncharacterized protein n=1 Tax=Portunus trituberculatus TaxID=210409 RepID=A0A5B7E1Z1_PORTR|nr:hypothetical protein [Portunus trituberculatus]